MPKLVSIKNEEAPTWDKTDKFLKHSTHTTTVRDKKTGKIYFEETHTLWRYDVIKRDWVKEKTWRTYKTPEEKGLKKRVEYYILFKKTGASEYDLRPITRFFKVKVKVSVRPQCRDHWLAFSPPDYVSINDLANETSTIVGVNDASSNECYKVTIGKQVRISKKEAKEMLDAGYRIFGERGGYFAQQI